MNSVTNAVVNKDDDDDYT